MRAQLIGRVLGVGLRVAGRAAAQQLSSPSQPAGAPSQASAPRPSVSQPVYVSPAAAQKAGQLARGASRGVGGFLKPFRRAGGILWLQITGSFYLLFALAFAGYLWKQRTAWFAGQDHPKFIIEAVTGLVFLYLALSAFWRAGRK